MMNSTAPLVLMAIAMSFPAAASSEPAFNEAFEPFAWLIGEWRGEFDIPGREGVHPTMTWAWGDDARAFIRHSGTQPGPDGRLVPEYESFVVRHPVEQRFVFLSVYLGGAGRVVEDGTIDVLEDGGIRLHMRVHYPAGATLPFSDGAIAGDSGHTLEFQRTMRPEGDGRMNGHFVIKRGGRWEDPHPGMNFEEGIPWVRVRRKD